MPYRRFKTMYKSSGRVRNNVNRIYSQVIGSSHDDVQTKLLHTCLQKETLKGIKVHLQGGLGDTMSAYSCPVEVSLQLVPAGASVLAPTAAQVLDSIEPKNTIFHKFLMATKGGNGFDYEFDIKTRRLLESGMKIYLCYVCPVDNNTLQFAFTCELAIDEN